jgi:hypothetical protein
MAKLYPISDDPARLLREEVISHYCRVCSCPGCGETTLPFLLLAHVVRRRANLTGDRLYRWLKQHNYQTEDQFQILCANCHGARGRRKFCPAHRPEEFAASFLLPRPLVAS